MTPDDFLHVLERLRGRGRDTTDIEVKRGVGGCPDLGPTLCAFGNLPSGGLILIGIDEANDFEPVGVPDPALISAGIASQARTAVTPPVRVSFQDVLIDGAVVVAATVEPLPTRARPCRHKGNAYLRQADGDYRMSEPEIHQILAQRDRPRHDATVVPGTSMADLDAQLVPRFIETVRSSGGRRLAEHSDADILRRRGIVAGHGDELTVAGLYALGEYPQQYVPSLSITAAVQLDRSSGARTRDLAHLDGPLPALLDDAMAWVLRNTRSTIKYSPDGHARDVEEIPAIAVREIVANALIHRDLSPHTQGKRVEIRLTNDQLVIGNPGGLWGINQDQLGTPAGKSAVNEFLYDIAKMLHTDSGARVIEGEGGGIRDARRAMNTAGLQAPHFIDRGVAFTVLIPRISLLSASDLQWLADVDPTGRLSDVQRRLAASMRRGRVWTNSMVRDTFGPMDSTVARSELQGLVTAGLVVPHGERGQTTYSLAGALDIDRGRDHEPSITVLPTDDRDALVFPNREAFVAPPRGAQRATPEPQTPTTSITTHAPAIWQALAERPLTQSALVAATGLTDGQVRYALKKLVAAGWISVRGGWGVRATTYEQTPREHR